MKIGVASDLHLEFSGRDFEFPEADVLVLAGDILMIDDLRDSFEYTKNGHATRKFLREASVAYKNVIYIPGNHEFYSGNIDTSCQKVLDYLKEEGIENITFGTKGSIDIDDVTFIYATLWTDINRANPLVVNANLMNDYIQIMCFDSEHRSGGRYLHPIDTIRIHEEHKKHISRKLENSLEKVVVVTHHAPNMLSNEDRQPSIGDYYYCCTDMDSVVLDNPKIKYWIHGHLHTRKSYNIGETVVVSNCRGYVGHEKTDDFEINVIEV